MARRAGGEVGAEQDRVACPKCAEDTLIEAVTPGVWFCNVCATTFVISSPKLDAPVSGN
jgi:ribosomal protein L37AE/L43A